MAAFPDAPLDLALRRHDKVAQLAGTAGAAAAAALGLFSIWPTILSLWTVWTTDALNSIGILVPVVAFALIVRAWKRLSFASSGTWWGLVLLLAAYGLTWCKQHVLLLLVLSPSWIMALPPRCFPLFVYGSGVVLLLGGARLYRASLFPLMLLWFAKPVPNAFSRFVDLPLQSISAHIARSFALYLGQHLTPDNLRLMFTPEFGMFIAPGCDGIRGAVTMGFIALIAGYAYRFRTHVMAAVTAAGVVLGYVFNFARLCLLVLYYVFALHHPRLQNQARNADLLIGGTLFLIAATLLFHAIQRFRPAPQQVESPQPLATRLPTVRLAPLAALCGIAMIGIANFTQSAAAAPTGMSARVDRFPAKIGGYTLTRSWTEQLNTGSIVYYWAEYAPSQGGSPVAIGISPFFHWHDPIVCHTARADYPVWQGPMKLRTRASTVDFGAALYSDDIVQRLDLSTQCAGGACGERTTTHRHFGLIYSRIQDTPELTQATSSVPVIVRAETPASALPADTARRQLADTLQSFLAGANLADVADLARR